MYVYDLRSRYELKVENVKTNHYGTEFHGKLCHSEIKSSQTLQEFKKEITVFTQVNARGAHLILKSKSGALI